MLDHSQHITLGKIILSVTVEAKHGKSVLVITKSPQIAKAVSTFIRELDHTLVPVWVKSVDKACVRLEWDQPKMAILDCADNNTTEAVHALRHISPEMELLFLGGNK